MRLSLAFNGWRCRAGVVWGCWIRRVDGVLEIADTTSR
ncbi:hypothetical protein MIZ03_2777 [Rhodoferax lithotrophicus]|uniref:Uncharacterized protein n=1 Tax=Rhodoferax lithotrophicus TaxID=2798804 RepID=A0ABM7MNM1_9BURK|nr:hypothetical protein MIZ03_2777 [Rhodoferax sp. MIZ03]